MMVMMVMMMHVLLLSILQSSFDYIPQPSKIDSNGLNLAAGADRSLRGRRSP